MKSEEKMVITINKKNGENCEENNKENRKEKMKKK